MKIKLSHLFCSSLLLMSVATHAAIPMSEGWYVEGQTGYSTINNAPYSGSISNTGIPWNADLGYKINPFFAMEIGFTQYASIKVQSGGTTAGRNSFYSYDFAGKGIVPLNTSGIDLFAKLGIGRLHSSRTVDNSAAATAVGFTSGSNSVTGLYFGVGADYAITSSLLGILQWARAVGSNSTGNMDLYSIGLSYLFE